MTKPLCVATHRLFPETAHFLEPHVELSVNRSAQSWPRPEVLARCASAQSVIAFMPDLIDHEFLDAAPHLRLVAAALKGFDNIDVKACAARGVQVSIVPDLLTVPTAELAIGLTIGLARHVRQGDADVRSGRFTAWRPTLYGLGLADATVGLLGFGRIGKAIAERLVPFGARLLAFDRMPFDHNGVEAVDAGHLASQSDIVIVCLPLTAETKHWVDANFLSALRPGALLINPARGSVVDEEAVADSIEAGRLLGYAADVFEFEDWARADRPLAISPRLAALEQQTLFTPHLGSATVQARRAIERAAAHNVIDVVQGRAPRDLIQPERASCNEP